MTTSLSRRSFIQGAAAMPLALWLANRAHAYEPPLVRYDIASETGAQMLQTYALAISAMQARGADDPLSWMWQWYTHFVDGTTTKADEITRIFAGAITPQSELANEMWNTCQSHAGQNPNHFLPWHRMYVLFLEQIVREISGQPNFTMPYWNYTSADPAQRGVVPIQFRMPDDPVFGSLYRPNRTFLANSGQPIHKNFTRMADGMDISVEMSAVNYSNQSGVQGFCSALNSGIHSRIHVLTGDRTNMGAVPYAGRDPLFFVHHGNTDRMWASWNRNGGVTPIGPKWARNAFVFADAYGQRVSSQLKDYFDIEALGYTYDEFIPPPAVASSTGTSAMAVSSTSSTNAPTTTVASRVGRVRGSVGMGAGAVSAQLLPEPGSKRTPVLGLDPAQPGKRTYLVIKGLHAWAQPEVLYHIFLKPGRGQASLTRANYVGNINFFDAEFHDHGQGAMGDALAENYYSFDVTGLLKAAGRKAGITLDQTLQVTFVPGGRPRADGKPIVGSVELIRV